MLFDFRSIITEEEDEYEDEVVEIIDGSGDNIFETTKSEESEKNKSGEDLFRSFEIDERRFQFESDDPESLLFPEFGFGLARSETISYSLDTWRYCKSCSGSTFLECSQIGTLEKCPINSFCFIEVRERRGSIVSVSSGCKPRSDCQNQQAQNARENSNGSMQANQCRPNGRGSRFGASVCRQCFLPCNPNADPSFCWGKFQMTLLKNWNLSSGEAFLGTTFEEIIFRRR